MCLKKQEDGSQKEKMLQQNQQDVGNPGDSGRFPQKMRNRLNDEEADRKTPSAVFSGGQMFSAEPVNGPYTGRKAGQLKQEFFLYIKQVHRIPPFFFMQASSSLQKSSYLLLAMGMRSLVSRSSSCRL